jgi:phenylpropionate dioxygenase-like ring-hydroxylating dioxygenase large terminal subunit
MRDVLQESRISEFAEHEPGAALVQSLFRTDAIAPPQTLLEPSDYTLGTDSISIDRYTSQTFYDREVSELWPRVWQYACWAGEIPNPGDISVYRNVGQSVLVVRQRDGTVKAFVNSCLHRGRELCDQHTTQAQLRCPYHGFTWGLEGNLKSIPSRKDFPQVEMGKFSLPEVRVEEWNGFFFINFDEKAVSLGTYLGKMTQQWREWDFAKKYKAVHVEKLVNCNWKATLDAFIEALHVTATHPQFTRFTADAAGQYDVYPDEPHFSRFHISIGRPSPHLSTKPSEQEMVDDFLELFVPKVFGTPEGELKPGETARQALARIARRTSKDRLGVDVSKMPESELVDSTEYFVFPNFIPWPSLAYPIVYRFRPGGGPDWCIWETMMFLPFDGERPKSPPCIKLGLDDRIDQVAALGDLGVILQQDQDNFAAIQRGMKASKTGKVVLSQYQEARIRHYHQTIDRYLSGDL